MSEFTGFHDGPQSPFPPPLSPERSTLDEAVATELTHFSEADMAALASVAPPGGAIPARGTELLGRVTGSSGDMVFIDLGLRTQGVLPVQQFDNGALPHPGIEVEVIVDRLDVATELLYVHRKGAVVAAELELLSPGDIVEGKVSGMIKGGLEVHLGALRGFMPASQVDPSRLKDISVFIGERFKCEVIEVDRRNRNVIVSRRKVVEREQEQAKEKLLEELAPGQIRRGHVTNLTEYGAFVDLGGVHGLLHINDLSWATVEKPSDVLQPGQQIDVMVLKYNKDRGRISLGLKQAQPDPWTDVEQRFPVGTQLKARVVRLADFGAFADVAEGVTGLIPLSEMSWSQRPGQPQHVVSVGDLVDVAVLNVDPKRRRIGLSIKQLKEDPWASIAAAYPVDAIITGKVSKILDFGALVELQAGVEGMVHISELSEQRVRTPGDVVQVGEEVQVKVLAVDPEKRRVSLSIRATKAPAEVPVEVGAPSSSSKPKRKKALRGGLASHFEW